MIRIAQLMGKMNGGGVEQAVMNYYNAIDTEKIQFDFFLFSGSKFVPAEQIKQRGGRIYVLPGLSRPLRYVRTLKKLLKDNGYQIAHCHLSTLSALPLLAAKLAGVRVRIVHNHSTSGGWREVVRNIAKWLLKPSAKAFATDHFACSEYASRWMYGGLVCCGLTEPPSVGKRVRVMRNAIDTEKFLFSQQKRAEIRGEFKIPSKALLFGHIGRFCPQKNQGFLIEIFAEILKQHKNSYLLMAGTGPDMELIVARAIAAGIADRVILAGQRKDADKLYSAFDCFIMPSNYEGLPVVGIEAQCSGLYCVFSDRITRELKISDGAQFLSLKSSASDWACAALCVAGLRNEAATEQVTEAGYDIRSAAKELEQFYIDRLTK